MDNFLKGILAFLVVFMIFVMSLGVAKFNTQQRCLDQGYPDSKTLLNYQGYCLNIDGDVQGIVKKLE